MGPIVGHALDACLGIAACTVSVSRSTGGGPYRAGHNRYVRPGRPGNGTDRRSLGKPFTQSPSADPALQAGSGPAASVWSARLLPALLWLLAALTQLAGAPAAFGPSSIEAGGPGRTASTGVASSLAPSSAGRDVALSQQDERRSPTRLLSRATGGDPALPASGPPPVLPEIAVALPPPAHAAHVAAGFLDSRFPTGPPARA